MPANKYIIKDYTEIVDVIKKINGLELNNESLASLAFLVEKLRVSFDKRWDEEKEKFKKQISDIYKKGGAVEVAWFLDRLIKEFYIRELENKKNLHDAIKLKVNLLKMNLKYAQQVYESGQVLTLGGISKDDIPNWYYDVNI